MLRKPYEYISANLLHTHTHTHTHTKNTESVKNVTPHAFSLSLCCGTR